MSQNKNNFPDKRIPFDKHQRTNRRELADIAAEQLARLFWEQIKYNHRKKSK